MAKKFKWGTEKQCGFIGCNKQIIWGDFLFGAFACENHWNRKWELCEACQTKKTTHAVFYNIHSNRKSKEGLEQVKEGIELQKEIIEKFFLITNISNSLRQKLNEAYQKAQAAEKIIPELERLTSEYWEKKINLSNDFIQEKGGQQTNIYRCNLCDNCGDEVSNRQQKLKNDYQLKVLDKLIVFDSETSAQIEKEIGRDKAVKIAFELTLYSEKVTENQQAWIRQQFIEKLPFLKHERSTKWHEDKRALLQKLKQYFQDNQIMQIFIQPNGDYVVWYTNGNVEEKNSSQLTAEVTWRRDGEKALSLYEINKELKSLEQEPSSPSKEEEKTPPNRDKENDKEGKINSLSDLELELVKLFFRNHKVKKIVLKNGELVITHNNNNNNNNNEIITAEQLTTNSEYQMIKNSLEKIDKNELVSQDLGINSDNTSTGSNNPKPSNYQLIIGLTLGAGTVILVGIIFYFVRKRKKR